MVLTMSSVKACLVYGGLNVSYLTVYEASRHSPSPALYLREQFCCIYPHGVVEPPRTYSITLMSSLPPLTANVMSWSSILCFTNFTARVQAAILLILFNEKRKEKLNNYTPNRILDETNRFQRLKTLSKN